MQELNALFAQLDDAYNAVTLFATAAVIEAAGKLTAVYAEMSNRARELSDLPADADKISAAIDENRDELFEARRELVAAMREDVGHRPLPST